MIGELIDHYRVQELVGRGAMGVVYKALDVNIDRQVAIKVMSVEARNDPAFVERFRQEARLQGALNHPNIALLFDYFIHNDAPVAVMEFIDGVSFEHLIRRRGAMPAYEVIPIFKQALVGVAAAHRAGIIHRDLKAANLMITRDRVVKVMDFGVAKRPGAMGATKASTSVGSPLCMAPEQILGRAVDFRTDVYALGVTLYELLSGQPPFNPRGKTEYSVLNAHVNDLPQPPTVHRRDIPQQIVDAVMRAIAKEPDARFQSVDEFMRALPDVPVPPAFAAPGATSAVAAGPQVSRTGTLVIPRAGPTGTQVIERQGPTGTVALGVSPQIAIDPIDTGKAHGERAPHRAAPTPRDPSATVVFDFSPGTELHADTSHQSAPRAAAAPALQQSRAAPSGFRRALRASPLVIAAALLATLLIDAPLRLTDWLDALLMGPSSASSTPALTYALTPPAVQPEALKQNRAAQTLASTPTPTLTAAPAPKVIAAPTAQPGPTAVHAPAPRQDLSGTWRGEYVDATGKPLLRVVSLRIRRVRDDGGIEGVLRYQAASGTGECKLHPRGSTWSAGAQRLQLSPEGCSPHYPKELGVPLDFNRVNPQANSLKNGRIEAPTGRVIRVRLQRVS